MSRGVLPAADGFLGLLKPPGVTSQDMVAQVVRRLGVRVGHAGTLDPDAVGVLVMALGQARKILQWVDLEPKTYWGCLAVGVATDTLDRAGVANGASCGPWPSRKDWARTARVLEGLTLQVPPLVSSRQRGGRRGHDAHRAGQTLWLAPRPCWVKSLHVTGGDGNLVLFETVVGRGTYVRALVRDWADAQGHAAHLAALIRLAVGPFLAHDALTLEELSGAAEALVSWRALWPHAVEWLGDGEVRWIQQGRWPRRLLDKLPDGSGSPTALVDDQGRLVAVALGPGHLARVFDRPWG